jgi:hypothetical protein
MHCPIVFPFLLKYSYMTNTEYIRIYQYLTCYFETDTEKSPIISSAQEVNFDRRILDTNLYVDDIIEHLSIFPVLWQLSPSSGTQTPFLSV